MKPMVLVFTLLSIGLLATPALAQSPTPSASPVQNRRTILEEKKAELKETMEQKRTEVKEQIEAKKQEMQQNVQERRDLRLENHAKRLEFRFGLYEQRLGNIATRIQTRIDKVKAEGKDVTSAQTKLTQAKTSLAQAVATGKQTVAAFSALTPEAWDTQKEKVAAAKALAEKTRQEFIATQKLMKEAVQALQ